MRVTVLLFMLIFLSCNFQSQEQKVSGTCNLATSSKILSEAADCINAYTKNQVVPMFAEPDSFLRAQFRIGELDALYRHKEAFRSRLNLNSPQKEIAVQYDLFKQRLRTSLSGKDSIQLENYFIQMDESIVCSELSTPYFLLKVELVFQEILRIFFAGISR